MDGDGRSDLLLVNWEDRNPVPLPAAEDRTASSARKFISRSPPIRSYWADNLEANKKTQVMTIAQNSGRAQISQFTRKPAEALSGALPPGPVPGSAAQQDRQGPARAAVGRRQRRRPARFAGGRTGERPDFRLFPAQATARWPPPRPFPRWPASATWPWPIGTATASAEIFLLSADERQVGVTRLDEKQRLPFPDADSARRQTARDGGRRAAARRQARRWRDRGSGRQGGESASLVTRTADGKTQDPEAERGFQIEPDDAGLSRRRPGRPGGPGRADSLRKDQGAAPGAGQGLRGTGRRPARRRDRAAVAERGGRGWRRQAGVAAAAEEFPARRGAEARGAAAELRPTRRVDLHGEGADQRRGQQFAPRRRRRRAPTAPTPSPRSSCSMPSARR